MFANNAIVLALAGFAAAHEAYETPTSHHPSYPTHVHNGTVHTITKVYTAYTTICPEPTQFEFNGHHYDVTEACTLTITDCPCTVTETTGPMQTAHGWGSGGKVVEVPPSQPEKPHCTGDECEKPHTCTGSECEEHHEVVTGGAGVFGFSFGIAAALGLIAL
ncbi:hypothetical protein BGZ63DRAFT_423127 [Mariannaea sp. PMI_226]|nr:hypothetical protein BGZ63DRAFT_423127 [Mariannaea sp. PMI_226]